MRTRSPRPYKPKKKEATTKLSLPKYLEDRNKVMRQRKTSSAKEADKVFADSEAEKAYKFAGQYAERLDIKLQLISAKPTETLKWTGAREDKPKRKPDWSPGEPAPAGWKVGKVAGHRVKVPGWKPGMVAPEGTKVIAVKQTRSGSGTFGPKTQVAEDARLTLVVRAEGTRQWKTIDKVDRRHRLKVALTDNQGRIVAHLVDDWTFFHGEDGLEDLLRFKKQEMPPLLERKLVTMHLKGETVEAALRRIRFPQLRWGQQIDITYRIYFEFLNPETQVLERGALQGTIYEDWRVSWKDPKKKTATDYDDVVRRRLAISIRQTLASNTHPIRFTTHKRLLGGVQAYRNWVERHNINESDLARLTLGDAEGTPRRSQSGKDRRNWFKHQRATEELNRMLLTEAEYDRLASYNQAQNCVMTVWTRVWNTPP